MSCDKGQRGGEENFSVAPTDPCAGVRLQQSSTRPQCPTTRIGKRPLIPFTSLQSVNRHPMPTDFWGTLFAPLLATQSSSLPPLGQLTTYAPCIHTAQLTHIVDLFYTNGIVAEVQSTRGSVLRTGAYTKGSHARVPTMQPVRGQLPLAMRF